MSTQPETTSQDIQQTAPLSVRAAAGGFLWGAIMLGILAWWLNARDLQPSGVPFWGGSLVLAIASLSLSVWYFTTAWRARKNPGIMRSGEATMRPIFSGAM